MSRERAIRRAAREAQAQHQRARRDARRARAARRRTLLRRVVPHRPGGRTGRMFARRSYGQRMAIGLATLAVLVFIWWYVPDMATRVALTGVAALALPALVVLTFDRRT